MSQSHEVNTVADIVRFWTKQSPGNVALVCDNTTVSYGLLDARSSQAANRMLQAGVGRGSRIGYLGVNSTGFFDTWFGAGKIGCAFAPFNWRLSPTELVEIIDDAQPAIVFVDTGLSDKIEAVRARTSSQYEVVVFDTALNNGLQEWAGAASSNDPGIAVKASDPSLLAYTSGTTGRPKGVLLSAEAIRSSFLSAAQEPAMRWTKDMVVSGGENVFSVEVERALLRHPAVATAAVIGTPDPKWGEKVTAFVVRVPGAHVTSEELKSHCRELLAGYKVPKEILLEDVLPMTANGKVQKTTLRKRFWGEQGRAIG